MQTENLNKLYRIKIKNLNEIIFKYIYLNIFISHFLDNKIVYMPYTFF